MQMAIAEPQDLTVAVHAAAAEARVIRVRSQPSYDLACEALRGNKALQGQVHEAFDPICDQTHKAWKTAVRTRKEHLEPLQEAEGLYKRAIAGYVEQKEQERREEQRKLEVAAKAEADKRAAAAAEAVRVQAEAKAAVARKQAAEEAEAAKAAGESEVLRAVRAEATRVAANEAALEAQHIAQQAAELELQEAEAIAVVAAPKLERAAGVSTSLKWSAQVTNLSDLVKAIADGRQPITLIQPDMTVLNKLARALQGQMSVPGVKAVSESVVRAGRKA